MDNQNSNNNEYKNVNAEVIGELRKEKIGNPIIALVMIVLFVVVIIALPFLYQFISDENGFIYKLFNKEESIILKNNDNKYEDASKLNMLNSDTKMIYNNLIIMKEFKVKDDAIECIMSSYNSKLNLDEKEYYLEIYTNDKNKVAYVKLTGTYDNLDEKVTLKNNFSFNSEYSYLGKIVLIKDKDYPEVTINSDESGIGQLNCKNDTQTIEYTFVNNYLTNIKDKVTKSFTKMSQLEYQVELNNYKTKVTSLGNIATISENGNGFEYNANIDLENTRIEQSIDYNYFQFNTEAKKVKYNIEGKGFECK